MGNPARALALRFEDPELESVGRIDERQRADLARRAKSLSDALTPRAVLEMSSRGRGRELVELLVEELEHHALESLTVHGPSFRGFHRSARAYSSKSARLVRRRSSA